VKPQRAIGVLKRRSPRRDAALLGSPEEFLISGARKLFVVGLPVTIDDFTG